MRLAKVKVIYFKVKYGNGLEIKMGHLVNSFHLLDIVHFQNLRDGKRPHFQPEMRGVFQSWASSYI